MEALVVLVLVVVVYGGQVACLAAIAVAGWRIARTLKAAYATPPEVDAV